MEMKHICKWRRNKHIRQRISLKILCNKRQGQALCKDKGIIVIIEENIILAITNAPNMRTPNSVKQILTDIKGEINTNTVVIGEFNTSFTSINK